MERRISKKIEQYQHDFKNNIKQYLEKNSAVVTNDSNITSDFLKFVYDFENIELTKEDFIKRKRVKNHVPHYERCNGKRANGEQCTRRKKKEDCFCGTHMKGTPHGVVEADNVFEEDNSTVTKIEVWVQEIKGINYYIDHMFNVYLPGDILSNISNPRKIGRWNITQNGDYDISYN